MVKTVSPLVCVFDCEYVPCAETVRRCYRLPADSGERACFEHAWAAADHDPKKPGERPMLKTVLHKVVSVSAVLREHSPTAGLKYSLKSWTEWPAGEAAMVREFLAGVGKRKFQLVGFASRLFDVPVLAQRALVHGLSVPAFFDRPEKPWAGADYLARGSDYHVDLIEDLCAGGDGKAKPSLDQIAAACGLPGKLGMKGADVAEAWLDGKRKEIAEYNDFDACTTFLLWARMAATAGHVDYADEKEALVGLLERESAKRPHLRRYLNEM